MSGQSLTCATSSTLMRPHSVPHDGAGEPRLGARLQSPKRGRSRRDARLRQHPTAINMACPTSPLKRSPDSHPAARRKRRSVSELRSFGIRHPRRCCVSDEVGEPRPIGRTAGCYMTIYWIRWALADLAARFTLGAHTIDGPDGSRMPASNWSDYKAGEDRCFWVDREMAWHGSRDGRPGRPAVHRRRIQFCLSRSWLPLRRPRGWWSSLFRDWTPVPDCSTTAAR